MRHQRGYIYEKFGAFHLRYYVEVDGKRKQKSHRLCAKDRAAGCGSPAAKAVRELAEDYLRKINDEPSTTGAELTVVDFWNTVYLPFIESNLKHSTIQGYKQIWQQHLMTHFGNSSLKGYRTHNTSIFLTTLSQTLRPRTLNHIKFLASSIFSHAVATGHCESNPIRDSRVLGKTLENGRTQAYSLEEIEDVISALVDRVECQLIMALAFFLGLRRGEIQGLQWEDVDGHYIHIRRSVTQGIVTSPKTLKSVRSIPLIQPVTGLLLLWRGKSTGSGWMFVNTVGKPVDLKEMAEHTIRPALKRAGVTWKGFHAGRRGLGTTLRALTGNSNAGRDVLGHSTTQVTEQHYEHAMPEEALKGMRLLEAKISGSPSSDQEPRQPRQGEHRSQPRNPAH